jgi:hypothetical protein
MYRKLLIGLMFFFILSGCYYDSEDELYGTCETTNVTYSQTITAIIHNYACLNCHGNPTSNGAPFSLDTYTGVKAAVDAGRLYGAISHQTGFAPMPQNAPKMNQCDINKVKAWIDAGALNN